MSIANNEANLLLSMPAFWDSLTEKNLTNIQNIYFW